MGVQENNCPPCAQNKIVLDLEYRIFLLILFEIAYQYVPYVALRIPWEFKKITVHHARKIKLF